MGALGVMVGLALLAAVTACAWLLGRKANASVKRFRAEQHESFVRRKPS
jgi:uncharacterized protein YdgA (DUF945 family)